MTELEAQLDRVQREKHAAIGNNLAFPTPAPNFECKSKFSFTSVGIVLIMLASIAASDRNLPPGALAVRLGEMEQERRYLQSMIQQLKHDLNESTNGVCVC